jgi:alanine-synthesizing transaminase
VGDPPRSFASRVPERLEPNRISQAVARRRAAGAPLLDLTESNPTRAGFVYPPDLLVGLAHPRGLSYDPTPFGLWEARCAVAAELGRRGLLVDAARIVLTASTSEAYSILFKLLCDPGDVVLVPQPSYPLFDQLARLDAVATAPFPLEYDGTWRVDVAELARTIPARARAVIVVNPNNPTGSFLSPGELAEIAALCRRHGLVLIGDEVFADYVFADVLQEEAAAGGEWFGAGADRWAAARPPSVLDQREVLTVALGGLSKAVGLPQLKLAWMALGGPVPLVEAALARLDYICDAYLSVATPIQLALGRLLGEGAAVRQQIARRVAANYARLGRLVADQPACRRLVAHGGWYGIVEVPALRSEEALVLDLIERDGVVVHPGYFFDFPREGYLVVSLLPDPAVFEEGVRRLLARATTP